MTTGQPKQHVPIFVGSTFEDLKDYRRAVRDALVQLETIVRGMEYFGSKPGSPVEECLAAVNSCKVYIGVFGMRYGTVPEGRDRSMTHLEYEEAQNSKLPSLIYILDEDNQPVLPRHVETGDGANALRALKEQLRRRHVVSTFTSPDDLARRVLHDVLEVLRSIGTKVEGEIPDKVLTDTTALLEKFALLPKLLGGRDVMIEFKMDGFHSVDANECEALRLEAGATVRDYATLTNGKYLYLYASGKVAEHLVDIPKGARVRVEGVTVYGTAKEIAWGEDSPITMTVEHRGVSVRKIMEVIPPEVIKAS